MKLVLGLVFLMFNLGVAQAKTVEYLCVSDDAIDFRLKVSGAHGRIFTISDIEETAATTAVVDEAFIAQTENSYSKRLKSLGGTFSLIGDNSTQLLIDKAILQGANVGAAEYKMRVRMESVSVFYTCNRIVKI